MGLRQEGYWDDHYGQELKTYLDDGDEGEIWFGKRLSKKIVDWLLKKLVSLHTNSLETTKQVHVIDIGCGNSFLLCSLVEKFRENIRQQNQKIPQISLETLGIDYSANSISLSSKIVQDKELSEHIVLRECDFIDESQVNSISEGRKFDFIIDKGTYDAICLLHSEPGEKLRQTKEAYLKSVTSLSKIGTIFILASCNHTEEELLLLFDQQPTADSSDLKPPRLIDRIETPSIQFGGKSGSQVTCLILEFIQ